MKNVFTETREAIDLIDKLNLNFTSGILYKCILGGIAEDHVMMGMRRIYTI